MYELASVRFPLNERVCVCVFSAKRTHFIFPMLSVLAVFGLHDTIIIRV